jgi:DnaJ-class molecular chaperone
MEKREIKPCDMCMGTGKIIGGDFILSFLEPYTCPVCHGTGKVPVVNKRTKPLPPNGH